MHSKRRLELVQKVTSLNYNSLVQQLCNDKVDYLQEFNEISEYDVFSVDGHYIEHSSHTQCDPKGKLYAAGNLYAINMRNSLMQHFAYVTDGTSKSHEMPYFREMVDSCNTTRKTIWITDRGFIDYRWWERQSKKGNYVISRSKSNSSITCCGEFNFDKNDHVNAGVVSDKLGAFTSNGSALRIIEYVDPETGDQMTFYSSLDKKVRPGLICWLYFLRWRIEKAFECFKNSLGEKKAWATGKNAIQLQGHFICLVYNFIQFLSEKTKKHEECQDDKAEKKYAKNLGARENKASKLGRFIHPLIYTSRRISRISSQFIRSVKNHFFRKGPLHAILPTFAERLRRYL